MDKKFAIWLETDHGNMTYGKVYEIEIPLSNNDYFYRVVDENSDSTIFFKKRFQDVTLKISKSKLLYDQK